MTLFLNLQEPKDAEAHKKGKGYYGRRKAQKKKGWKKASRRSRTITRIQKQNRKNLEREGLS